MAIFDLGNNVRAKQSVNAPIEEAYELAKRILLAYKRDGYQVRFPKESKPNGLVGTFSKGQTRIQADVRLSAQGNRRSSFDIKLTGKVEVTGWKAAVATDDMVRDKAKEALIAEIKNALKKNGLAAALGTIADSSKIYYAFVGRYGNKNANYA